MSTARYILGFVIVFWILSGVAFQFSRCFSSWMWSQLCSLLLWRLFWEVPIICLCLLGGHSGHFCHRERILAGQLMLPGRGCSRSKLRHVPLSQPHAVFSKMANFSRSGILRSFQLNQCLIRSVLLSKCSTGTFCLLPTLGAFGFLLWANFRTYPSIIPLGMVLPILFQFRSWWRFFKFSFFLSDLDMASSS